MWQMSHMRKNSRTFATDMYSVLVRRILNEWKWSGSGVKGDDILKKAVSKQRTRGAHSAYCLTSA